MSMKTLGSKLHIKENSTIMILNEPKGYRTKLGKLPPNVTFVTSSDHPVDVIQVFVVHEKDLINHLSNLKQLLTAKGALWVTYPKGTSNVETDLNRDIIRKLADSIGLQAIAMIAVDETWSALRLKIPQA